MAIKFSNLASTTLASGVSSTATSVSVTSASSFPTLGSGDYFYATIGAGSGSEIVKVTGISGTTFTVSRGEDGTTAVSHSAGVDVALRVTAGTLEDLRDGGQVYTAGSGLGLSGNEFTNTAPDQTVSISGSGSTTVTGTYPSFTVSSTSYSHPSAHPISFITGLQTALDGKVDDSQVLTDVPVNALFTDTVYTHPTNHSISFITGLQSALDGKVDDSQVLTNVPSGALFTDTVYTLPFTDNSTNWNTAYGWGDHSTGGYLTSHQSLSGYATETYVGTQISNLVDSSPAALNTLNELAAALGDDPNFATTVSTSIGTKLPLAGGTLTGALSGTTATFSGSVTAPSIRASSGDFHVTRSSDGASAIRVDANGVVVIPNNYFYVPASQGSYFSSTVRFRGTIHNDTGTDVTIGDTLNVTEGIKLNGTTVIDASRNLTNIGTISSGAITVGGIVTNAAVNTFQDSAGAVINFKKGTTSHAVIANRSYGFHNGNGLSIATMDAQPIRFGINDVEKLQLSSAGDLDLKAGVLRMGGTGVIDSSRNLTNVNLVKFRDHSGSFYISPTNPNTLNGQYGSASDTADMWINYRGYQDGWTHFRDFRIGDGKGIPLLFVDGSARAFDFQSGSSIQIGGTTVIDSSRNLTNIGNITTGADSYITFGPNSTWANSLRVGGNGRAATGTAMASVATTNGNLHLDAASSRGIYLNHYAGTAGTLFGNGAGATVARMDSGGQLYKSASTTNPYWNAANDGSGSGLDADLLDGQQGSYYAPATGGSYLPLAGGTLTGNLNTSGSGNYILIGGSAGGNAYSTVPATTGLMFGGANDPNNYSIGTSSQNIGGNYTKLNIKWHTGIRFFSMSQYGGTRFYSDAAMSTETFSINNLDGHVRAANNLYANGGNLVWNASNDGSGSGLDADLLDGIQGASFLRSDAADTIGARLTMGLQHALVPADYGIGVTGIYSATRYQHVWSMGSAYGTNSSGTSYSNMYGLTWTHTNIGTGANQSIAGLSHQLQLRENGVLKCAFGTGIWTAHSITSGNQGTLWGSSNDGSGSGLDADLLDGQQGSYYYAASNPSGYITSSGTANQSHMVSGNAFATTGSPGSILEYQQASGQTDTKLAPSGDWYNSIRMGHGNPYSYYSNTMAMKMTGTGVGTLYTQTISNNNAQGWNKHWHSNNDGSGSGLDADLLDGYNSGAFLKSGAGDAVTGWWISAARNGNSGSPQVYFSHSSGYGMHINTYNTSGGIYALELHNNSNELFAVRNNGDVLVNGTTLIDLPGNTYSTTRRRRAHNTGHLEGSYNNIGGNGAKSNPIYTIGNAYNPADSTLGNMYGIGFTSAGASFINGAMNTGDWGMYVAADGDARVWLEGSQGRVVVASDMRSPLYYDSNNTGYYLHPDSTSNLNAVSLVGALTLQNKIQLPSGSSSGSTFGANHYSMGVDIANGGWSGTNYSDLIIGYHTGIRIGGGYSGVRFYNNSPTTDANNDGNGDSGEALLMTIGGGGTSTSGSNVVVANSLYATDVRASTFYDKDNTGFYVDPGSTSRMVYLRLSSGDSYLKIGANGATTTIRDTNRPQLEIGDNHLYPHLTLQSYGTNTTHGGAISFRSRLGSSGFRRWNIGTANYDPESIQIGYFDNQDNPHYGVGVNGWTYDSYSRFVVRTSYSEARGSMRSPLFYDLDDTGYYVDPHNISAIRRLTLASSATTTFATPNVMSYASSNTAGAAQYHIRFVANNGNSNGNISTNYYQTTYATTSDYRVKEDFQPMVNATSRLMSLNPVNFQWKDSDMRTDGFLAHEVAEVVSDAVVGEKDAVDEKGNDELQSLDQGKLVPLLVKTIQEQQGVIEALEARISALEA